MVFSTLEFLISTDTSIGFGLNRNIFETNLINQLILIISLVFLGRDNLQETLNSRQSYIIKSIQDSESRLLDAETRLIEVRKQLSQVSLLIINFQEESSLAQTKLVEASYLQTRIEIKRKLSQALETLRNCERNVLLDVKHQISILAIDTVVQRLQEQNGDELEQKKYMDSCIQILSNDVF